MHFFKQWIKKNFSRLIYRREKKIARKHEILKWLEQFQKKPIGALYEASFDIFTYHGEDGIVVYLLQKLNNVPKTFVDIGAGDCIKSNCATLVQHFAWEGIFIDKDEKQLEIGKSFYKSLIKHGARISFVNEEVTISNINTIISGKGMKGEIGLLSIDIDGNDYWVWKAIEVIGPRIVIIEAKVEFGYHKVIVPYGKHNHHSVNKMYNGASVESLKKLGEQKGYKLVGAIKQGYNLFFIRQNENLTAVATKEVLEGSDTAKSFYTESFFEEYEFIIG